MLISSRSFILSILAPNFLQTAIAANELYEGPNITSDDVWVTSKEKQKENEARGNIYYDYKRNRALDVYEQLKNSIYKLLNVNK